MKNIFIKIKISEVKLFCNYYFSILLSKVTDIRKYLIYLLKYKEIKIFLAIENLSFPFLI